MANWTRDELILALDLYFREPEARTSKAHPVVRDLSDVLNALPIHNTQARATYKHFRNIDSVLMKLANFQRLDPDYEGKGLERGSRLDKEIWQEFANDRERLGRVAKEISRRTSKTDMEPPEDPYGAEAVEGKILSYVHKRRERSRRLIHQKKQSVLKRYGRLTCEVCSFDFQERYGERGAGFAECHHIIPISELNSMRRTLLSDLAIVCANCHRMIHSKKPWLTLGELSELLR